jgi:hypothetical protein
MSKKIEIIPFEFDIGPIQGCLLNISFGYNEGYMDDGGVTFEKIVLIFDNFYIEVSVNIDNDEIIFSKIDSLFESYENGWNEINIFKEYHGKPIGWIWAGINWLGYKDIMMISFAESGMVPNVIMMGEASDIRVYKIRD